MNTDLMKREQLSALADGELQGEELAQALQFATQDEVNPPGRFIIWWVMSCVLPNWPDTSRAISPW